MPAHARDSCDAGGSCRTRANSQGDATLTYNTDWKAAIEAYNMLDIAEASSKAALMREESRGHSYRPEFPQEDPANWTCNIVARNVNGEMKLETVPVVELD